MFKLNKKGNKKIPLTPFWCLYFLVFPLLTLNRQTFAGKSLEKCSVLRIVTLKL